MEKIIANAEKNMASNVATMETNMHNMQTSMATSAANVERKTADMKGTLDAVNNKVTGMKIALVKGFNELKDVLAKMEDKVEANATEVRNTPSGDRESIIMVAGGHGTNSVEMFNWRQRTWSPLQYMPTKRWAATSFVYNNHVTIAGGYCPYRYVDDMIRMNIHPKPDLQMRWIDCPTRLPSKLRFHSSVLYNDHLMISGGYDGTRVSGCIREVQLVPPYTVKTLSRMLEPRQYHCMERFEDSLLIVGGRTTSRYQDSTSSVVLYDIMKKRCKQMTSLPYAVSRMATVRWGDNIVVVGGIDKHGNALNTVLIYNVKTEQSHMLPTMRYRRWACTAVVIGNNIVVLGGQNERQRRLKSVEVFNFESYTWQDLPEMSEGRFWHSAVVVLTM
jgi:hypothetical protein